MSLTLILLDALRIALLIVVIGYAAISDYKFSEVKNKAWIYAPFGLSLTFLSIYLNPDTAFMSMLSMIATICLSLALFYLGGWGGADGKAFITIAASMPLVPFSLQTPIVLYPLAVVMASAVLSFAWSSIKQRKVPVMQRQARFLPYTFVCLFIALLL